MFEFIGNVESSKSLVNRALVTSSYNPDVKLQYQSSAEDVQVLEKALVDFRHGKNSFDCGAAGTAFRFWCLRISRDPGVWTVRGSQRLLQRPQQGLVDLLTQLSVEVTVGKDAWVLHSRGWKVPAQLKISTHESSQFFSSMMLNAWGLEQDLTLHPSATLVSEAYLQMTLRMLQDFGMAIEKTANTLVIKANQWPRSQSVSIEADVSSCFALVACALQQGQVCIQNFPIRSQQPDFLFVEILQKMGAKIQSTPQGLQATRSEHLIPLTANLQNTPDLFPVLAVLCARARGVSQLSGLSHLAAKESDRLKGTMNLLKRLGRAYTLNDSALSIEGREEPFRAEGLFDPDQDHRMAMAAQVANFYGAQLQIQNPEAVNKSFPQFWKNTGVVHES